MVGRRNNSAFALFLALLSGVSLARADVGHLPGEFSVDATGAATYQIPLRVPVGAAGMQPELAFLYHSRAGNGQLGLGWSLSGLSVIARCSAMRDSEGVSHTAGVNLSPSDRFCLDGQPLRHQAGAYGASGTLYFTEVQSSSMSGATARQRVHPRTSRSTTGRA